jgi:hypothetical protein
MSEAGKIVVQARRQEGFGSDGSLMPLHNERDLQPDDE